MKFELDCSLGEGGGSIVRISVALAAATRFSLKLVNIRAKRSNPGLRTQHIEAINAIQQLSGISVRGSKIGSQILTIEPEKQGANSASVNISTAGSVALVAQAVMFYSIPQKQTFTLSVKGGATHGKWAPSIDYIKNVTHSLLRKMNKSIEVRVDQCGFFPQGGSNCHFTFAEHQSLNSLNLIERGSLEKIDIYSTASKNLENRKVAERQVKGFVDKIKPIVDTISHVDYVNSVCPGTGLTIVNEYSSGTKMGCFVPGERKISAEYVGELCSKKWKEIENSSASVDQYAADQLIIPLSLIEENSVISTNTITNHTRTNIELAKKFTQANIRINKRPRCYIIEIKTN
ncbi:MAG: RNA 3'-phosphate cyclase [Candidatus Heimdallarchaeota archaeon]|nr:RNA 3'-phosphate cyclase [Candidatus Heimdallarchaeota archaeon]MCK4954666.1 RNA 3'-phosphate cyclase [Candidatus Heimdallarchaeota archaeon]